MDIKINMDNTEKFYDPESNIYWIKFKDGEEDRVEELTQGILVEFNSNNEVIGLEISNASQYFETNVSYKDIPNESRILPFTTPVQSYVFSNINIGSASVGQPVSQSIFL